MILGGYQIFKDIYPTYPYPYHMKKILICPNLAKYRKCLTNYHIFALTDMSIDKYNTSLSMVVKVDRQPWTWVVCLGCPAA